MRLLTIHSILVATDLAPTSQAALRTAHRLARVSGGELHVVHAIPGAGGPPNPGEAVMAELRSTDIDPLTTDVHVLGGEPAAVIGEVAERVSADVIVLGPHRGDRSRHASSLGPTAYAVVTAARAPCLITPRPLRLPLEHVVVPVDLSETARGGLLVGISWASALRSRADRGGRTVVDALHVERTDEPEGAAAESGLEREVQATREVAGEWTGVELRCNTIRSERPAPAISAWASDRGTDLLVLGTRGLGLDDAARLGSVSAEVVRAADVPVLLVPPAVWLAQVDDRA